MSIFEKLTKKTEFTDTEKRIADFILENEEEMPTITISYLSKRTYSSHSAVIRLTKKMGYSGFKEFRVALIQEIQNKLHKTVAVDPNFPFDYDDSYFDIAKKMADLSIDAIRKTILTLDRENIDQIARALIKAERIFLFGLGDSQIRAKSFQNKFSKINKYLILADEYSEGNWNTLNMTKNDCAIFITYGGGTREQSKNLAYIRKKGIDTILITGNKYSPMGRLSKYLIEVPQGEVEHVKVGTFLSQISFEYVLDTLFAILFSVDYAKNLYDMKVKQEILLSYTEKD
ncbi:MurR/RpiR family transcriptional regulator [Enterococcus sp. LJL99]